MHPYSDKRLQFLDGVTRINEEPFTVSTQCQAALGCYLILLRHPRSIFEGWQFGIWIQVRAPIRLPPNWHKLKNHALGYFSDSTFFERGWLAAKEGIPCIDALTRGSFLKITEEEVACHKVCIDRDHFQWLESNTTITLDEWKAQGGMRTAVIWS